MPTFYDPKNFDTAGPEDILNGDENKQIKVLRDFIFTLSSPTENSTVAPTAQPTAENITSPQKNNLEEQKNLNGPTGRGAELHAEEKPETPAAPPTKDSPTSLMPAKINDKQ